jgi:hypothetical protein
MNTREHHQHQPSDGLACARVRADGTPCPLVGAEHDIAIMRDPDAWPAWPVLPLKRPAGRYEFPECGFVLDSQVEATDPWVVYQGTIYEVQETLRDKSKHLEYDSPEAIVTAGWIVD